jgi:hypothetical protein
MIQILFWVLLILWAILGHPWPNAPWPPWSGHIIIIALFVCLGLAVFGLGLEPRMLPQIDDADRL